MSFAQSAWTVNEKRVVIVVFCTVADLTRRVCRNGFCGGIGKSVTRTYNKIVKCKCFVFKIGKTHLCFLLLAHFVFRTVKINFYFKSANCHKCLFNQTAVSADNRVFLKFIAKFKCCFASVKFCHFYRSEPQVICGFVCLLFAIKENILP